MDREEKWSDTIPINVHPLAERSEAEPFAPLPEQMPLDSADDVPPPPPIPRERVLERVAEKMRPQPPSIVDAIKNLKSKTAARGGKASPESMDIGLDESPAPKAPVGFGDVRMADRALDQRTPPVGMGDVKQADRALYSRPAPTPAPAASPSPLAQGRMPTVAKAVGSGNAAPPVSLGGIEAPADEEQASSAAPAATPQRSAFPSMVDALTRGAGVDDYSFITRAGEDAGAAWMNERPDHAASDRVARMAAAAQARPAQMVKAQREDLAADRKALVDEAQIKKWLAEAEAAGRPPAPRPQRELTEDERRFQKARADKAEYDAAHAGDPKPTATGITPAQKMMDDRDLATKKSKALKELGQIVQDQSSIAGVLKEIEELAPGATRGDAKNIPGAGGFTENPLGMVDRAAASLSGGALGSDKATQLYALQERLKQFVGKEVSGLVLNETELRTLAAFMGTKALVPPDQFARAAQVIREALLRNVQGRRTAFGKTGTEADRYAVLDDFYRLNPNAFGEKDALFEDLVAAGAAAAPNGRERAKNAPAVPATNPIYDNAPPEGMVFVYPIDADGNPTGNPRPMPENDPRLSIFTRAGSGFRVAHR